MKWIGNVPYAIVGASLGAFGFFVGNLFFHQYRWQLFIAPIVGAAMGFLAGLLALRRKKMPLSSTMREFSEAMRRNV